MTENASAILAPWSNFYVVMGSSAAALTGLMFVVITLVKGTQRLPSNDGIAAFSTPTVAHFCAALLVSAIAVAPWHWWAGPATLLALAAAAGIVYVLRATHRARQLTTYSADFEDWTWYAVLPLLAYLVILAASIELPRAPREALFGIAAGVALLIFIGIRNSWDIVTYIAIGGPTEPPP